MSQAKTTPASQARITPVDQTNIDLQRNTPDAEQRNLHTQQSGQARAESSTTPQDDNMQKLEEQERLLLEQL